MMKAVESVKIVFGSVADVSDIHDPFNFLFHSADEDNDHDSDGEEGHAEDGHDDEAHEGNLNGTVGEDDAHDEEVHEGDFGDPLSMTFFPIFDHIDEPRNMVGILTAVIYWRDYIVNVLPPHAQPILIVLGNECGQSFSYRVVGEDVEVLGEGDMHESRFDHMEISFHVDSIAGENGDETSLTFSGVALNIDYCPYHLRIFPTSEMQNYYQTNKPMISALLIVAVFAFASAIFVCYDILVANRQKKVSQRAAETSAVVNSLFPANVRDRLFQQEKPPDAKKATAFFNQPSGIAKKDGLGSLPIADLFPKCTVCFADIAGFTAWSSSREPTQVFTLLETIYGKFDSLARKRKVFKVETIGDCYMCVTGCPDQQDDHALRMVQFACKCLEKMNKITRELEVSLGPDTGNLTMRIGIHSGPVTAGVLRGEKSRFQLFGDTVNTASRMESTGQPSRVQCSEATAMIIIKAGKEAWLTKREDAIYAKGKGIVQTYWINASDESSSGDGTSNVDIKDGALKEGSNELSFFSEGNASRDADQMERSIDWNVDLLHTALRKLWPGEMERALLSRQPKTKN
jgi:class 3 adenylate cyclase